MKNILNYICVILFLFSSCEKKIVDINVESVFINKTSISLVEGETILLVATVLPENATKQKCEWESTDENIVSVSKDGLVTAKTAGEAKIIVRADGGIKSAECLVVVLTNSSQIDKITLNKSELDLLVDESFQLEAAVSTKGQDVKLKWTSSNEKAVNVDETGLVTGIAYGISVVTVSTEDGAFSASCMVKSREVALNFPDKNLKKILLEYFPDFVTFLALKNTIADNQ